MSYKNLIYHLVFPTKERRGTIVESIEGELYAYLCGIVKNHGGYVFAIGGMPDHIHIVLSIPTNVTIDDFVKKLKQGSSLWIHQQKIANHWEGWAKGFAIFSCSYSILDNVKGYVNHQKQHHKGRSFTQELTSFLDDQQIPYNVAHLLGE